MRTTYKEVASHIGKDLGLDAKVFAFDAHISGHYPDYKGHDVDHPKDDPNYCANDFKELGVQWPFEGHREFERRPLFIEGPAMGYGDYGGDIVYKANLRAFLSMVDAECLSSGKDREHYGVWEAGGSHGWETVYLEIGKGLRWGQWLEDLQSLGDYLVLDDDALYEVEEEGKLETWNSWLCKDVRDYLESQFEDRADFTDVSDDDLFYWFNSRDDRGEWHCEGSGTDMYIHMENLLCDRFQWQNGRGKKVCIVTVEELAALDGILFIHQQLELALEAA